MRDYAKIGPKAWQGQTFKKLRKEGREGLLVALYLMSSPSSNMLGIYSQPILYMAHETGLGQEGALKGLTQCIEAGFCAYDHDTEMVWVYEMAKYQVAAELKATDLRCKGIQKDYDSLPDNPFLGPFFDHYAAVFHLTNRREFEDGMQGALIAPYQAPSKPRTGTRARAGEGTGSPSLRSGETAAAKPPRTPREPKLEITLQAYLEACKAKGVKAIPDDHHIRTWAADAGIGDEMLQVAWLTFRDRHIPAEGDKTRPKRQKDWPLTFANAVKDNWYRLWFIDGIEVKWTSQGQIQRTVYEKRIADHNAQQPEEQPA